MLHQPVQKLRWFENVWKISLESSKEYPGESGTQGIKNETKHSNSENIENFRKVQL